MKKICLLALLCCAVFTQAQRYEVGQLIPQGTWSALVVYVDESGEHGLMMSPTAMRDGTWILKHVAKKAGMSVEDFVAALPLPLMSKGEKDSKIAKVMKAMMKQNLNGTNGVENCKNIADYCEANGLPMEAYFPEMAWAASLGEGWFIPGTDELEIYAKVIARGVGKKNYKGHLAHADDHRKELNMNLQQAFLQSESAAPASFPQYIGSSTFACNKTFEKDPANKGKIAKMNGLSIVGNVNYIYFGLAYFKNQINTIGYYVFNKKGVDYQPYTNAFKWF